MPLSSLKSLHHLKLLLIVGLPSVGGVVSARLYRQDPSCAYTQTHPTALCQPQRKMYKCSSNASPLHLNHQA
ncbi:hypothetical protein DL96DRAFT_1821127 [Flagelloscypha sp. PMI_526]|nr:hypothetical protein DL96DRAFT_1821127 [Flagelloscypha sp. PMI_526]